MTIAPSEKVPVHRQAQTQTQTRTSHTQCTTDHIGVHVKVTRAVGSRSLLRKLTVKVFHQAELREPKRILQHHGLVVKHSTLFVLHNTA